MPKCSGGGKGGNTSEEDIPAPADSTPAEPEAAEPRKDGAAPARRMPKCSGGGKGGSTISAAGSEAGERGVFPSGGDTAAAVGGREPFPPEAVPATPAGGRLPPEGGSPASPGERGLPPAPGWISPGGIPAGRPEFAGNGASTAGGIPDQPGPAPSSPPLLPGIHPGRPPGTGQPAGVHPAPDRPGVRANHSTIPPTRPATGKIPHHRRPPILALP